MAGLNEIPPLVSLAPMAGVTDIPFRRQVKAFGGTYCVSEMVASEQLALQRVDMARRAAGAGVINPLVIQLAGRDAHWMAEGARLAELHELAGDDLARDDTADGDVDSARGSSDLVHADRRVLAACLR